MKTLIADIERASVHDGPGMRTVVFFKGCPLNCKWCHNPECIAFEKQMLFYPEKCIGCGKCGEDCYSGARIECGREYTPEELLTEIMRDKDYYRTDGGVTFSGGEPLAHQKFLEKTIDLCTENGIRSAVETSLIYYNENIFKKLNVIMADFKIWDNRLHKKYTGVSNIGIMDNFKRIDKLGIPIIARTPVICEIEQGIEEISGFLKTLDNVVKYELLPYHPLGVSKQKALGIDGIRFKIPDSEYMNGVKKYAFVRG